MKMLSACNQNSQLGQCARIEALWLRIRMKNFYFSSDLFHSLPFIYSPKTIQDTWRLDIVRGALSIKSYAGVKSSNQTLVLGMHVLYYPRARIAFSLRSIRQCKATLAGWFPLSSAGNTWWNHPKPNLNRCKKTKVTIEKNINPYSKHGELAVFLSIIQRCLSWLTWFHICKHGEIPVCISYKRKVESMRAKHCAVPMILWLSCFCERYYQCDMCKVLRRLLCNLTICSIQSFVERRKMKGWP